MQLLFAGVAALAFGIAAGSATRRDLHHYSRRSERMWFVFVGGFTATGLTVIGLALVVTALSPLLAAP